MSTVQGFNSIQFSDGSQLTSNVITQSQVINEPTTLSQFTNDLGNYGGWLTSANVDTTARGGAWNTGGGSVNYGIYMGLTWNGTQVGIINTNCACNC